MPVSLPQMHLDIAHSPTAVDLKNSRAKIGSSEVIPSPRLKHAHPPPILQPCIAVLYFATQPQLLQHSLWENKRSILP
jgi:hypothetical protein